MIETAIALLSLKNKIIPPTLNCENQDKKAGINIVKEKQAIKVNTVAKMSCGFAGFNGVAIFKKIDSKGY